MKIVIFGAGAIGSLFGAHLAKIHDVTLICREGHAREINRNGLRINGLSDILVNPGAFASAEGLEQPDILFLTVKAYDTERAIKDAMPLIGPETIIVDLQNGLGNLETIARILPDTEITGGVTSHGAILKGPGIVEHTGRSYTTVGGGRAVEIASILNDCGIETTVSNNIQVDIWYKAIVNAVINPIGTLMRERNGILVSDRRFHPLAREIVNEAVKVAGAREVILCPEFAWNKVVQVATGTARNICSMRLDIEKGRRTEIDQMNGAISRYGSEIGIPTPVNSLLAALISGFRP